MPEKTVVGLDIGSTSIRGVEAVIKNGVPYVTNLASVKIPGDVVEFGEVINTEEFTKALKTLWKQGKFSAKEVRVVINSENNVTSLKDVEDEKDFAQTLPFKLRKSEVFDIDEYYLSYHTINKYTTQVKDTSIAGGMRTVPMRKIFLAGAPKELADKIITAIDAADLRPISLDVAPLALIRAEQDRNVDPNDDGIDIHVNIGGDMTSVVISLQNQPVSIRTIAESGGNKITRAIMHELKVDAKYAEQLKIDSIDMPATVLMDNQYDDSIFADETPKTAEPEYSEDQIAAYAIVIKELSAIINNINQSINYFVEQNRYGLGHKINHVHVSGGTANFSQIRLRLAREIGVNEAPLSSPLSTLIEVGQADPKLTKSFAEKEFEYVLAVGAAIGNGAKNNG